MRYLADLLSGCLPHSLADPDLHHLVIGFDPLLSSQSEVGLKSAIEKVIEDFKSDLGRHGTTAVSEGAKVLDGSILALRGAVVRPPTILPVGSLHQQFRSEK